MSKYKYLRRQGNIWYVELVIPTDVIGRIVHDDSASPLKYGKPRKKFCKSLKTSSVTEAAEQSYFYLAKWFDQIAQARNSTLRFHDTQQKDLEIDYFLETWLGYHKYSIGCELVARKLISEEIKEWFPTFSTLNERRVKFWIKELANGNSPSGRKLSRGSIARHISSIKSYVEYCNEQGLINHSYVPSTKLLPKASRTKANRKNVIASSYHPFTRSEVRTILRAAARKRDRRLYYLIALGLFTGCRISEICSLQTNSVSETKIIINDSKTYSGVREIPIHPEVWRLIQFLRNVSIDEYIISGFSSSNRQLNRAKGMVNKFSRLKNELGFGHEYGFHSFRSTLAHQLENTGANEIHAARILGHSVKSITYGLYSGASEFSALHEVMKQVDLGVCNDDIQADLRINFND